MATLRSLGISKPAGLAYLAAENPKQTSPTDYTWSCSGEPGDELLVSGSRVVWTRHGVIHQVYNFELEKEKVSQALFATFPDQDPGQALVVLLRTQAHVYFKKGGTHIVNLPFEVRKAFSTPYGLVLQRAQAPRSITISFQATKTPANSFAISQLPHSSPESWRSHILSQEPDPFYKAFFKPETSSNLHKELPNHVYLRDPLTELGLVGQVEEEQRSSKTVYTRFSHLQQEEDLVYVSSTSEIVDGHFLLAVSRNQATSQYTVWKIVETPERVSLKRRRKVDEYLDHRRRSSHGFNTGTTTPALRQSINPRESFGGFNDNRNTVKSRPKTDAELASQLDVAFEGPAAASQSSRRISSLLARSDLATANDAVGVTETMLQGGRRGTSFGGPGVRASFGGIATSFGRKSGRFSHIAAGLGVIESNDVSDNSMDTESDDDDLPKPVSSPRSLKNDLAFVRIHELGVPYHKNRSTDDQPRIVVVQSTNKYLEDIVSYLVVYIHDPDSQQVICLNVGIVVPGSPNTRSALEIRMGATVNMNSIAGICKIGQWPSNYCAMLFVKSNRAVELVKQTGASGRVSMKLPETYLRRNPYRTSIIDISQKRREGGLRRVLSEGIDRITGLRSSSLPDQFEVADSKNTWHRLEVIEHPASAFVQKLLDVCELVFHSRIVEPFLILQLWNDVRQWYTTHHSKMESIEWRAFLTMIVSLFAIFLPPTPITVQKRRKTGLLRSSSGAQVDTESFDMMMLLEDNFGTASPPWQSSAAWNWTTEPLPSIGHSKIQPSSASKQVNILTETLQHARDYILSSLGQSAFGSQGYFPLGTSKLKAKHGTLTCLLAALHLLREEEKLNILNADRVQALTPLLAQMGGWLGCSDWGWKENTYYSTDCIELERWEFDQSAIEPLLAIRPLIPPPSIFSHAEIVLQSDRASNFPSISELPTLDGETFGGKAARMLTPRTTMVMQILSLRAADVTATLESMIKADWDLELLETLPEGMIVALRSAIALAQAKPPPNTSNAMLRLIDREDLQMLENYNDISGSQSRNHEVANHTTTKDYHDIVRSVLPTSSEDVGPYSAGAETDRTTITRLIFPKDQRFTEASRMVNPLKPPIVRFVTEPDWTEQQILDSQQEIAKIVAFRTLSVSPGRAMLYYNARHPLLTEKFPIHGFTLSVVLQPSDTTVVAERTSYTEEKVSWAFFHAGVEAGLTISRDAKGIDTSWILFNKPKELGDRHAGFLLALGLNGHLKKIAKWVAFKYLTPKHTMTSIGLLLGLAASHIGSMDALITRLMSVHVTRMLPPGAAELNLSPLTQTTGIMALGLLYHNTQHRRMTEIMISELEWLEQEDGANPNEDLRGEGYRLAAGFALGYINLGHGRKTKGLQDMRIVERLLSLVVAVRQVSIVHILDKATAGATIALALIFLKTEDQALANKIDIPDTVHQFEYVRPDVFLLRTVARHLIMWNGINASYEWMRQSLPVSLRNRIDLGQIRALHTEDLPLYNILAGLCMVIGLRYAGSASIAVRDLLLGFLDHFIYINKLPAFHYDGKLTRVTTRNCQDVIALSAAAVMAGTGDLHLLRRLRSLHARTDGDTPYGSHLAAHQAIGLLFLAGGTHTLGTSNLAVASLLCAFYPLFPAEVEDNKAHLQAFRHLWVLAAEPRCLVIRNADTLKSMSMKIRVIQKDGKIIDNEAPCLLPELDTISRVVSNDRQYWEVVLDLENNPAHLAAFKQHQSMFVRKKGPHDTAMSVFSSTMQTLNAVSTSQQLWTEAFQSVFDLHIFQSLDYAERALILPGDGRQLPNFSGSTTRVDDRLALEVECLSSFRTERLWNLRVLFAWAEYLSRHGREMAWLGRSVVESIQAKIAMV